MLVSEKDTPAKSVAVAVTRYGPPAMELAPNSADAIPYALVGTVILAALLLTNVPDAPKDGAVNTTLVADNGLPAASVTVTAS